ncbi:uncharacterized protein BJ171DRAFT_112178 [Polychytrium aggregatum]|uniref:uncharacterized protein n=1 Tax=Polychytrium aggregatum TaxID=110093 RepID=UPI0022FE3A0A|nr:uncharacterized protein BJ171DRAFT_112178 [Polychytrium aggregatum]KAI9209271.1 hypothetical protein BJ171DRAFT_112178 [Polychytrium aggregatum]
MPADPEISFRQQLWVMLKLRLLIFRRDSALIIMGCVYPIIMIGIASGIAGASTNIMASLDSSILNFGLPVLAADLGRSNAFQLNSSSVTNLTFGLILQGAAQPLASALASGYNTLLSAQLPHVPINLEQFTSLSDFGKSLSRQRLAYDCLQSDSTGDPFACPDQPQ